MTSQHSKQTSPPSKGVTVVIPTVGRETLADTIASVAPQLNPEDAVVVVSEGSNLFVKDLVREAADMFPEPDWSYVVGYGGNWGHPNRNHVFDNHVETTHVWTIDDDDVATPTALQGLRAHFDDPWTVFRMTFGPAHFAKGLTIWRHPTVTYGDIGTPMLFAPLGEARFGEDYSGDYDYALALQEEHGDPVFCEDIVAIIRPKEAH